jgi:bifunctional DNA-binding transcriptional regulator/antitoxin component of YhaV-PrlF toxin-antitoxin module
MNHNYGMKTLITMDPSGRLVLPKSIRQSLNTPRTAVFEAEVLGKRLELTLAEPEPAQLRRKGKLLVVPRQGAAVDAVKAVDDTRKDRL